MIRIPLSPCTLLLCRSCTISAIRSAFCTRRSSRRVQGLNGIRMGLNCFFHTSHFYFSKNCRRLSYFFILSLLGGSAYSQTDFSVIPSMNNYSNNENVIQVPYATKNSTREISEQKFPDEIKDQTMISKKINKELFPASDQEVKSFLEKKNYLKENKKETSLWQGATIVVAFLSFLGSLAYILTRLTKRRLFKISKEEQAMNIISTLNISPKRQIMLIQIRDKEIVLSNTETGLQFLSEISNPMEEKEFLREKKSFPIGNLIKKLPQTETVKDTPSLELENKKIINEKKSDILIKALKRMEKEPSLEKTKRIEQNTEEQNENSPKFPKYFSNIFENEAKKDVKKREDADSVENVTNLIREKLRSMKPLN